MRRIVLIVLVAWLPFALLGFAVTAWSLRMGGVAGESVLLVVMRAVVCVSSALSVVGSLWAFWRWLGRAGRERDEAAVGPAAEFPSIPPSYRPAPAPRPPGARSREAPTGSWWIVAWLPPWLQWRLRRRPNFNALAAEIPHLHKAWQALFQWNLRHPKETYLDLRVLGREEPFTDPVQLALALQEMKRRGFVRQVFRVVTPGLEMIAKDFDSPRKIPARLKDRNGRWVETDSADIVSGFLIGAAP
jgi:hypothetical protein